MLRLREERLMIRRYTDSPLAIENIQLKTNDNHRNKISKYT